MLLLPMCLTLVLFEYVSEAVLKYFRKGQHRVYHHASRTAESCCWIRALHTANGQLNDTYALHFLPRIHKLMIPLMRPYYWISSVLSPDHKGLGVDLMLKG